MTLSQLENSLNLFKNSNWRMKARLIRCLKVNSKVMKHCPSRQDRNDLRPFSTRFSKTCAQMINNSYRYVKVRERSQESSHIISAQELGLSL